MAREKTEKGDLLKDWFGRRAEDSFTNADDSKRLFNWDKGRKALSSHIVGKEADVKESAKMTGSMFRVMGVDKHIKLKDKSSSSNMNKIALPIGILKEETPILDDEGDPTGEVNSEWTTDLTKLDAFYGAAIQNAAKFGLQNKEEHDEMHRNKNKENKTVKSVLSDVLNTERLDNKIGDTFPGYLKFVQKYKDYTFHEKYEPVDPEADPRVRLLDLIVRMMRYPASVTDEEVEEFKEPLEKLERIIKKTGGIPQDLRGCNSMATSLSNIVYKYVTKEEEEEEKEEEDGDGPPSSKMDKSGLDGAAGAMSKSMDPEDMEDVSEEDIEEFEDEMEEGDEDKKSDMYIDREEEGHMMEGSKIIFTKSNTDRTKYIAVRDKIDFTKARIVRALFERKSKNYDFAMKGMKSGRLDPGKIAEAVQGVPTVYERIASVKTSKVTVGVLIDESGSMSGDRIRKAREAAIYINEIFNKMRDVTFFIYGHTADLGHSNTTDIMVYREPGFQTDKFALGAVEARCQNRDGFAILACAQRMRSMTPDLGILFVISDGQPAASGYGGRQGIEDTRKKVSMAQQLGFQVIQIAIDESVPSKDMFDYYVTMTDIKTLPTTLATYMANKVDKLIKETITL